MIRAALALLLAAPLAAEPQWTLRHQSAVLGRDSASMLLGHEEGLRLHDAWATGPWRAEWNVLARALSLSQDSQLPKSFALEGRSRSLQAEWKTLGLLAGLEADQLNLRWQGEELAAVLGRQSVNLGEAFFFSPLDLFAPFAPQEAYRDFRAGVDALRVSWAPSDYSLVETVAVGGWKPSPPGSALPDALDTDGPQGQSSLLLRAQANGELWSLTALGGRFRDQAVGGAAVQLEFWGGSWGLEGLWRTDLNQPWHPLWGRIDQHHPSWTFSHSRQWSAWLSSRFEHSADLELWFREGGLFAVPDIRTRTALSLQAQAGPLWSLSGTLFATAMFTESSDLQLSAARSLSNDSSLGLTLAAPLTWTYGRPPISVLLELRTTL